MDCFFKIVKNCISSLLVLGVSNVQADSAFNWGAWDISSVSNQVITPDVSGLDTKTTQIHKVRTQSLQNTDNPPTTLSVNPEPINTTKVVQLNDGSTVHVNGGTVHIDGDNISIVGDNVTITSGNLNTAGTVITNANTAFDSATTLSASGNIGVSTGALNLTATSTTINQADVNVLSINSPAGTLSAGATSIQRGTHTFDPNTTLNVTGTLDVTTAVTNTNPSGTTLGAVTPVSDVIQTNSAGLSISAGGTGISGGTLTLTGASTTNSAEFISATD